MWFYVLLIVGIIGAFFLLSFIRKIDNWGMKKRPEQHEEDQLKSRPPGWW